jgi:hypothetical protein
MFGLEPPLALAGHDHLVETFCGGVGVRPLRPPSAQKN